MIFVINRRSDKIDEGRDDTGAIMSSSPYQRSMVR